MIADEGCAERGCPMHDSMWTPGVPMVKKKEWQGLTDEEITVAWNEAPRIQLWVNAFARAIEAKLKEKNA